jgi:hypothetical protein
MIKFLQKLAVIWAKNANLFANFRLAKFKKNHNWFPGQKVISTYRQFIAFWHEYVVLIDYQAKHNFKI